MQKAIKLLRKAANAIDQNRRRCCCFALIKVCSFEKEYDDYTKARRFFTKLMDCRDLGSNQRHLAWMEERGELASDELQLRRSLALSLAADILESGDNI